MRYATSCFVVILFSCFDLLGTGYLHAVEFAPSRARLAWKYLGTKDKKTQIFKHRQGKQWNLERSDGKATGFTELRRNDEQIILQNNDTKLIIRLTAGRGFWRLPKDPKNDWKTWVQGEWIDPSNAPAPAVKKQREYVVKLAYFLPLDRRAIPNYDRKIGVVMQIVSELYRDDLRAKGFDSGGFHFEQEQGRPIVHLIRGEKTAGYYNNAPAYDAGQQWKRLVPEIRGRMGSTSEQVIIVFAETYDNGPAEYHWPGVIARGAYYSADGGLGIYTSQILKDAFCGLTLDEQKKKFFDQRPVPGRRALGHRMNSPRCEFVEDGIGAVAHELGHAFGLPHDRRRDDVYIMGNGFRNLRQNFSASRSSRVRFSKENARLLMSSRYINAKLNPQDNTPPEALLKLVRKGRSSLHAEVSAKDTGGLKTVVFMDKIAGTVIEGRDLEGTEASLRQQLPKVASRNGEIEVLAIVTDTGGNQTRVTEKLKIR